MQKDDLDKLIRIADSVRDLSIYIVKLESNDGVLDGIASRYKAYYELIKPMFLRNVEYQREFQAQTIAENLAFRQIIPAFISLSSFLDSVIRQETISSRTVVDQIKREFFIEDNKPFSAYRAISDIVSKAATSLKIVDNYLESTTLEFFFGVNKKVPINTLTKVLGSCVTSVH